MHLRIQANLFDGIAKHGRAMDKKITKTSVSVLGMFIRSEYVVIQRHFEATFMVGPAMSLVRATIGSCRC